MAFSFDTQSALREILPKVIFVSTAQSLKSPQAVIEFGERANQIKVTYKRAPWESSRVNDKQLDVRKVRPVLCPQVPIIDVLDGKKQRTRPGDKIILAVDVPPFIQVSIHDYCVASLDLTVVKVVEDVVLR